MSTNNPTTGWHNGLILTFNDLELLTELYEAFVWADPEEIEPMIVITESGAEVTLTEEGDVKVGKTPFIIANVAARYHMSALERRREFGSW